jgi:hypothetical protein
MALQSTKKIIYSMQGKQNLKMHFLGLSSQAYDVLAFLH